MEEARHEEAYELFQREMGDSLQRSEMAKEHLGMPLYDERALMSTMSSNSEQDCTGEVLSRTQKPCTMDDHGVIESSARFCYDDRIESPKYRAKGGWVVDGIDEVGSDEEQSEFKLTRFDMDSEEEYQVTCPLPVFSFSADFASPCSVLRTPIAARVCSAVSPCTDIDRVMGARQHG